MAVRVAGSVQCAGQLQPPRDEALAAGLALAAAGCLFQAGIQGTSRDTV